MSSNQNSHEYDLNLGDNAGNSEVGFTSNTANLLYRVPRKLRIVLCILLATINEITKPT